MILILGNPGAGKTTQTQMLAKYLSCSWFSMGELIRKGATGQARRDMLAGKIISDDVTLNLVDKTLKDLDLKSKECVFEGNPRSVTQAEWWLDQAVAGRFKLTGVIHLVADPAIAEKRMLKRGRLDDHDDDVIEKRYAEYRRSITPTLNYLKEHDVPVYEINGNGTIEEIANQIHKVLGV
ncbi:nucleoside monophosphate kinase [Candidatus Saccharibacteria bacterium]|nr:nucleoside monophosphate kinase [Candidatus Saccharibacteria bacterium]